MILFIILLFIAVVLTIFTIAAISVGGAVFVILFSDVIVCIALIIWLLKRFICKKR